MYNNQEKALLLTVTKVESNGAYNNNIKLEGNYIYHDVQPDVIRKHLFNKEANVDFRSKPITNAIDGFLPNHSTVEVFMVEHEEPNVTFDVSAMREVPEVMENLGIPKLEFVYVVYGDNEYTITDSEVVISARGNVRHTIKTNEEEIDTEHESMDQDQPVFVDEPADEHTPELGTEITPEVDQNEVAVIDEVAAVHVDIIEDVDVVEDVNEDAPKSGVSIAENGFVRLTDAETKIEIEDFEETMKVNSDDVKVDLDIISTTDYESVDIDKIFPPVVKNEVIEEVIEDETDNVNVNDVPEIQEDAPVAVLEDVLDEEPKSTNETAVVDSRPLSERFRPMSINEVVGQKHLIQNGLMENLAFKTNTSMIFYGEPGIGKTTIANIISENIDLPFVKINATIDKIKDVEEAIKKYPEGVLMYIDEIQYFNKKQQQKLLPGIEAGTVRLIAATTENPYHSLYKALLSRCQICEFRPVTSEDVKERIVQIAEVDPEVTGKLASDVVNKIAELSAGDVRRALTTIDTLTSFKNAAEITLEDLNSITPKVNAASFDMDGDAHYTLLSALQKSIRGSDADAANFYLARLLHGGDMISPIRRLLVIASEDIGLADPYAITHTLNCANAAREVGMPEARFALAQAATYLAMAPKSNSMHKSIDRALELCESGYGTNVPDHMTRAGHPGYLYPHNYPNKWVRQDHMPENLIEKLAGERIYTPADAGESERFNYWEGVKSTQ